MYHKLCLGPELRAHCHRSVPVTESLSEYSYSDCQYHLELMELIQLTIRHLN